MSHPPGSSVHGGPMGRAPKGRAVLMVGDLANTGDAFLATVAARQLRAAGFEVLVVPYRLHATDSGDELQRDGFAVLPLRQRFWGVWRWMLGGHLFFGGGHAIREPVSLAWLAMVNALALSARLGRGRVEFLGVGATALRTAPKRWGFALLLALSTRVVVRDEASVAVVRRIRASAVNKLHWGADLALASVLAGRIPMEPGLCLVSPAVDALEGRAVLADDTLSLLLNLHAQGQLRRVLLVPHDWRPRMDQSALQALQPLLQAALPVPVALCEAHGLSARLIEPYQRAQWVLTGRLHGLLVGVLAGCRVIYFDASAPKLAPFGRHLGAMSASEFLAGRPPLATPDEAQARLQVEHRLAQQVFDDIGASVSRALLIDDSLSLLHSDATHGMTRDLLAAFSPNAPVRRWRQIGAPPVAAWTRQWARRRMLRELHQGLTAPAPLRPEPSGTRARLFLDPLNVLRSALGARDTVLCHGLGSFTLPGLDTPSLATLHDAAYTRIRQARPGMVFTSEDARRAFHDRYGGDYRFSLVLPLSLPGAELAQDPAAWRWLLAQVLEPDAVTPASCAAAPDGPTTPG